MLLISPGVSGKEVKICVIQDRSKTEIGLSASETFNSSFRLFDGLSSNGLVLWDVLGLTFPPRHGVIPKSLA